MAVTVLSWNMQGWGDGKKLDALFSCIKRNNLKDVVILLQECGNPAISGLNAGAEIRNPYNGETYICRYSATDPAAKSLRCTTAILTSKSVDISKASLAYPKGVTRPLLYIIADGTLFATIHAIANAANSVDEIKGCMQFLEEERQKQNISFWILMGDFNAPPFDFVPEGTDVYFDTKNKVQIRGSSTRVQQFAWMLVTRYATQGSDLQRRESYLDYAFMSINTKDWEVSSFNPKKKDLLDNQKMYDSTYKTLSDHNMVGCIIQ